MKLREEIDHHERASRLRETKEKEIKKKEAQQEAKFLKKQEKALKEVRKYASLPDPFRRVWSKQEIVADPVGHKLEQKQAKIALKRRVVNAVAEHKEKQRIAYKKFKVRIEKAREERAKVHEEKHEKHLLKALEA